ncbi:general stress protein [Alteribacter natronophilus]|uniref:general stress protein n=1 Tax=Alteribacter natronophilus TaxID=2583810 RepID=UPI00110F1AC9|nr:general stress protein [Alteribacter natronophilus]TMW70140.1 general stress protein [Alteribacter natronophilus]
MEPLYKEFFNDEEVVKTVEALKGKGVDEDNVYVLTHDEDRTERVADNADANTVNMNEQGIDTSVKNVFRKKGDELRAQFEELGFSGDKAHSLEEKLDEGKVIVVVKDAPADLQL